MATTLEYGKCAQCGRENPKVIQECRGCQAALPWAKVQVAPRVKTQSEPFSDKLAEFGNNLFASTAFVKGLALVIWLVGICMLVFRPAGTLPYGLLVCFAGRVIWRMSS